MLGEIYGLDTQRPRGGGVQAARARANSRMGMTAQQCMCGGAGLTQAHLIAQQRKRSLRDQGVQLFLRSAMFLRLLKSLQDRLQGFAA